MDPVQHFDGSLDFIDGFLFVYFAAPHFPRGFLMLPIIFCIAFYVVV
jgi:hypothetical protein